MDPAGYLVHQRDRAAVPGQVTRQRGILLRELIDPPVQQGQHQVGLGAEPGIHHSPGEPRLVGNFLHRRGVVAAGQEDAPGGIQHQGMVALALLGTGPDASH